MTADSDLFLFWTKWMGFKIKSSQYSTTTGQGLFLSRHHHLVFCPHIFKDQLTIWNLHFTVVTWNLLNNNTVATWWAACFHVLICKSNKYKSSKLFMCISYCRRCKVIPFLSFFLFFCKNKLNSVPYVRFFCSGQHHLCVIKKLWLKGATTV